LDGSSRRLGRTPEYREAAAKLSARQRECLRLAADGLTSREIAQALQISPRTVDQYLQQACERLGARRRTQAIAVFIELTLLAGTQA
jgi:DNA-binding CsgD family transcriptional regulator